MARRANPQGYNFGAPTYRPWPPQKRKQRSCCSICLWMILILLLIIAGASAVFYATYRPHPPAFSVASLQLSTLKLTDTTITSAFKVALTARNPNSGIAFFYDQSSVRILSGGVGIGKGSFPAFTHDKDKTTSLKAQISSSFDRIDGDASALKSSVKSKNLPLNIQLDTNVQVEFKKIKTMKLGIRVTCDGIRIVLKKGKTASVGKASTAECKVGPKILNWSV